MSDFSVYTLASGSSGNCVYIRMGEDEILVDAGISAKRITDSLCVLGGDIKRIKGIFITHEHSDHVCGLETLAKKYHISIHFTEPSLKAYIASHSGGFAEGCAVVHPPIFEVQMGNMTLQSFVTPHDSAASVGYVITDGSTERTVAVATDIGYVTDEVCDALLGVKNIILESNHDENMLLCGPYPYELKRRILSNTGHLSNEAASALIARLAAAGTERILLAHLSLENNLPELAYHSALQAVGEYKTAVSVASPNAPTQLI